ncbi:L,D-transpeptidase family protein [Pararhizobium gei]|uniref:L,D-transpeptidase family protein n=1 Tax=Pararhizobium gei TaxID=1395951 RepID=UPI0023DA517E|nr:murein L,D-transpeptidase family protein [Rhizobium gei]
MRFPSALRNAATPSRWKLSRALAVLALGVALSGCMSLDDLSEAPPKLTGKMMAEMSKKGMKPESPVLVRIFKQESELEVWKVDRTGAYALLKTYPICRWSGELGPKTKTGDRHAPEGFYHVSAGMLNPNSKFYVSFNLGYPNRLEKAKGYTGEALMVHGACSSSGCYAMTDQGVGEIYAVVQKALSSGQERFQVQAYPFRMTAKNMATYRGNENMSFWRTLKEGYDAFEVTRRQPAVSVCGGRYVFNRTFEGGEPADPLAACPPAQSAIDTQLMARVEAESRKADGAVTGDLPMSSSMNAYVDGGMHPSFRALLKQKGAKQLAASISATKYPISRPDAALADPFDGR